jgi:ferredoxin-type protein NapH
LRRILDPIRKLIPFILFSALSAILMFRWPGFLFFAWIGACVSIGIYASDRYKGREKQTGRKIAILLMSPVFLLFLGFMQRENLQLEETVFYLAYFISGGIFTRVLIHYAIAKVGGPLIFGRGFCGWACWTAALLEWLPIRDNKPIPTKYQFIRYLVFIISLIMPFIMIQASYDYISQHIYDLPGQFITHYKYHQLLFFLAGNGLYYAVAVPLAFIFRKKRAFCKIACPVSLVMKIPARYSVIKKGPTGETCTQCSACNRSCPMDVDVMGYISNGRRVGSTECILCNTCVHVCPVGAIR